MTRPPAPGPHGTRWAITCAGVAVAVLAATLTHAAASSLTMSQPPGVRQSSATYTVVNSVRDQFTVSGTVNLTGQVSDFNSGAGFVVDTGPTWTGHVGGTVSSAWSNSSADYVTRATGGSTDAAALVRWLTRRGTVTVTVTTVTTATDAGVIAGSGANGGTGVVARAFRDGPNYSFQMWRVDSPTTISPCGTAVNVGTANPTSWVIALTHDPSAPSVATARLTQSGGSGGGPYNIVSTCDLSTATGEFSGMWSGNASTARYDNLTAVL